MLAAGNRTGQLYVWDSADWLAAPRTLSSGPQAIDSLDLIAFGDRLLAAVTCTSDGGTRLILWDVLSGDRVTELEQEASRAWAVAAATEGDDLLLAVGWNSGQVRICRPLSGEILDTISVNDGTVWALDWAKAEDDRLLLAIASNGGTVQVWDHRTASVIATFNTGGSLVVGPLGGYPSRPAAADRWRRNGGAGLGSAVRAPTGADRAPGPGEHRELRATRRAAGRTRPDVPRGRM